MNQPTQDGLQSALNDLGQTPEQIYTTLKSKGIKGYPRKYGYCPVANYLKIQFGDFCNPGVGHTEIMIYLLPHDYVIVRTPTAIQEFMCEFDDYSSKRFTDLREAEAP